jgi:hypothetical protein
LKIIAAQGGKNARADHFASRDNLIAADRRPP